MSRELLRRTLVTTSCRKRSISSPLTPHPPNRSLHYVLQRDTDKTVPTQDIFIRTADTAPVLTCLNYDEIETRLKEETNRSEILTGTFVINAVRDTTSDKLMRKERGVASLAARVKETRVLAVCDADAHAEVLAAGGAHCIAPENVAKELTSVDEYSAVVCTNSALESLRPLGRVLKAKMPHERRGTVAPNIMGALRNALLNVEWEMQQSPNHPHYYNVTLPLIKAEFPAATIRDHVAIMFSEIVNFCPAKRKSDTFIERVELNRVSDDGVIPRDPIHVDIREHLAALKPTVEVTVLKKKYSREETWALRKAAEDKRGYLEEEKDKIAQYLEDRWKQIEQQS